MNPIQNILEDQLLKHITIIYHNIPKNMNIHLFTNIRCFYILEEMNQEINIPLNNLSKPL